MSLRATETESKMCGAASVRDSRRLKISKAFYWMSKRWGTCAVRRESSGEKSRSKTEGRELKVAENMEK
jgi:hypothetical protein